MKYIVKKILPLIEVIIYIKPFFRIELKFIVYKTIVLTIKLKRQNHKNDSFNLKY